MKPVLKYQKMDQHLILIWYRLINPQGFENLEGLNTTIQ
jgi:hypothetical protein